MEPLARSKNLAPLWTDRIPGTPILFEPIPPRRVLANTPVGVDAFVLRFERRKERLIAGRHVNVGLPGSATRPYSLYSGEEDPFLEVLVRRVEGGRVSSPLSTLQLGDGVRVDPPRGSFTLAPHQPGERLLFIATGTGVAPFRSFLRTHPGLEYTLVHGVRYPQDNFGAGFCDPSRYVLCVTGPEVPPGAFSGRVTAWLDGIDPTVYHRVYLCGNAKMILEVLPALVDAGVDEDHIHTETYF